jgi:hypothetical protein
VALFEATSQAADKGVFPIGLLPIEALARNFSDSTASKEVHENTAVLMVVESPDTDSFSARCQNREGHSPLAIHTAAFVHVLVLLAAGFAFCFGKSINLT